MQDMEKLFGRWDATHLLHDASLDSFVKGAFLHWQCIITWGKYKGPRFTDYTTYIAPNKETTHINIVRAHSVSTIHTIVSM